MEREIVTAKKFGDPGMVRKRSMKRKVKLFKAIPANNTLQKEIFFILAAVVLVLGTLNIAQARGLLIPQQPQLVIIDNTIDLSSMTLEQKIAQMVVVHGGIWNLEPWKNMQLGGIHLFALEREELYIDTIGQFQNEARIPFFVSIDLEGCWNPLANFRESVSVSEITEVGQAFQKGSEEGEYLKRLGFTINFAPVVDLDDQIWGCRSFPGDETKVASLAEAYVLGLQNEEMISTAKHYPGKTLVVRDPHKYLVVAEIADQDIYPYQELADNVKSVMVSHVIVSGAVDSEGLPSVVSSTAISALKKNFAGLIISDEINMLGLKNFYSSQDEMYLAVFKAGNDLVLNFNEDPNEIKHMIEVVAEAVEGGEIPEEQIDGSVRKILELKGFTVS